MALTNFVAGTVISSTFLNLVDKVQNAIVAATNGTWNGGSTAAASAITATSQWAKVGNTSTTASSIYSVMFPAVTNYSAWEAILHVPAGSTATTMTAVGAYFQNDVPVSGATRNAVALFGAGYCTVNSSAGWGINTLLQDNTSRAIGALTGVILSNELDFNIMCPGTVVNGLSVGGNSLSQPTTANGFIVNTLGTGIRWTGGLLIQDNVTDNGISVGLKNAAGVDVASAQVLLSSRSAANVVNVTVADGFHGHLRLQSTGADAIPGIELATAASRILADFSNATAASRTAFQSSTLNGSTIVAAIPNGTGTTGAFTSYGAAAPDNSSFVSLQMLEGSTKSRILSSSAGTGTTRNFSIEVGSNISAVFDTAGSVQLGLSTIATGSTDGFPYIPAAAGTPTGAATAKSGFVPMYYDTTANKIWFRSGGTWRGVVVA